MEKPFDLTRILFHDLAAHRSLPNHGPNFSRHFAAQKEDRHYEFGPICINYYFAGGIRWGAALQPLDWPIRWQKFHSLLHQVRVTTLKAKTTHSVRVSSLHCLETLQICMKYWYRDYHRGHTRNSLHSGILSARMPFHWCTPRCSKLSPAAERHASLPPVIGCSIAECQ